MWTVAGRRMRAIVNSFHSRPYKAISFGIISAFSGYAISNYYNFQPQTTIVAETNKPPYYVHTFNRKRETKPVRVLVVDGGGLRGCLTAQILKEVESKARIASNNNDVKISDLFDLIIGTSTGGLIALGLGIKKMSVDEMDAFYNQIAVDCFKAPSAILKWSEKDWHGKWKQKWYKKATEKVLDFGWWAYQSLPVSESARYSVKGVEKCLSKMFDKDEKMWIKNCVINKPFVAVVACEATDPERAHPILLRNYDPTGKGYNDYKVSSGHYFPGIADISIWQAARSTSAAPTYFKSVKYELKKKENTIKHTLIDGGLNANTPSLIAFAEAKKLWPDREIFVFSVGTGQPKVALDEGKQWAKGAIDVLKCSAGSVFSGKEAAAMLSLKVLASTDLLDHLRYNPSIDRDKTGMDKWRFMNYWRVTGREWVNKEGKYRQEKLDQMVSFLLRHSEDISGEANIFRNNQKTK